MRFTPRELENVFRIKYAHGNGTVFMHYSVKGGCFATAAHIMRDAGPGDNFFLQKSDGEWKKFVISAIEFCDYGYDICVFSTEDFILAYNADPHAMQAIPFGHPVKFVGFPHDLISVSPNSHFPLPLVRTAHFSGVVRVDSRELLILDGFNNPGYSGSPVYFEDNWGMICLLGLISSYRYETRARSSIYKVVDGVEEQVADHYTKPNSGMIQAIGASHIIRLVEKLGKMLPVGISAEDLRPIFSAPADLGNPPVGGA